MAYEFKLPDIGEGVVEGEIVRWLVNVGDTVREDQPLVEVMTDKATVEIPSPLAGRVSSIPLKPGQIVKVGGVLLVIEPSGAGAPARAGNGHGAAPPRAAAETIDERPPTLPARPGTPAAPRDPPARAAADTIDELPGDDAPAEPGGRPLAAPAVRKLARELGVSLEHVHGSGPGGRVRKGDVETFAAARARPAAPATDATASAAPAVSALAPLDADPAPRPPARGALVSTGQVEERIPLRGLRKRIAEAMARSKRTAAHFTYVDEVDVTGLVALRDQARAAAEAEDVKLTYLPFIVKACVAGLKRYPTLNSTLDEEAQEIVLKRYYNIGIAVSVEDGLVVPNVKDADRKSVFEIAREIADLGERTRAGRARIEELSRGTFTVTSLGKLGGLMATPIINFPEVAILGVHKIALRPMCMEDGSIVPRQMMWLSCSFDHRVIDGATGAEFVSYVKDLLEDPTRLLLAGA